MVNCSSISISKEDIASYIQLKGEYTPQDVFLVLENEAYVDLPDDFIVVMLRVLSLPDSYRHQSEISGFNLSGGQYTEIQQLKQHIKDLIGGEFSVKVDTFCWFSIKFIAEKLNSMMGGTNIDECREVIRVIGLLNTVKDVVYLFRFSTEQKREAYMQLVDRFFVYYRSIATETGSQGLDYTEDYIRRYANRYASAIR